jgi:hypothetical protein
MDCYRRRSERSVRPVGARLPLPSGHSGRDGPWSSSPFDWFVTLVEGVARATPSTARADAVTNSLSR